ncbi:MULTISPECIES: type II toxin-antitoxin system HicB family antitoxin [unclassified Serratia (in: enterobacteria)]|uniref:type II toxin-antitoxin system HicB family antitoxin n=1 Tax=unclassified Serratia (in: enterobacteria) TaxID=2647522 RepID=UPI00046ACE0D|nr:MULTISPECIES: type II toxin-antitoxin system HicB family antitoxin [unclassified Serratia (in: enterobacteria)]
MFYAAYIHSDPDGSASGFFPDVPGCYFAGDSLDQTFQDAKNALDAHFELLSEDNQAIPRPQAVSFHLAQGNDALNGGQWLLVDINMDKFDGRAERINITLPHRLLNRIDLLVQQHPGYGSRSAFLAAAARNELLKAG